MQESTGSTAMAVREPTDGTTEAVTGDPHPDATAPGEATDPPPSPGGELLQAELLETSFALVAPSAEALVDRFYFRLFRAAPEAYHLFDPGRFGEQKKKLLAALKLTVNSARKPEALAPVLQQLGAKHVQYGVRAEHYPVVGSILLATLEEFAGDAWTPDIRNAWVQAYSVVSDLMLDGARA